jgi:hypothetical protein
MAAATAEANSSRRSLRREWTFWVICTCAGGQNQYQIEEIRRVASVDNFYQCFTALPKISSLKKVNNKRVSIALFEERIQPAWEDKDNANGGSYSLVVPGEHVDEVWFDLLLCAIGGDLQNQFGDKNKVTGLVAFPGNAKIQPQAYGIEVWLKNVETGDPAESDFKKYLDRTRSFANRIQSITFKSHNRH